MDVLCFRCPGEDEIPLPGGVLQPVAQELHFSAEQSLLHHGEFSLKHGTQET